jgi:hypothetical protein
VAHTLQKEVASGQQSPYPLHWVSHWHASPLLKLQPLDAHSRPTGLVVVVVVEGEDAGALVVVVDPVQLAA